MIGIVHTALVVLVATTAAIKFHLEPSKSVYIGRGECVTYRIPPNQLVTGKLSATSSPHHTINAYIYGRDGSQPISLRNLNGQVPFSFLNGEKQNEYDVCFRATAEVRNPGQPPVGGSAPPPQFYTVGATVNHAPNLFDETLANEAKKPVEHQFIVSEGQMRQLADELSTYLKNEEHLRDVNESTLERVTWLSVISILSLVAIGVWQVYYLKGYFRTKKLI